MAVLVWSLLSLAVTVVGCGRAWWSLHRHRGSARGVAMSAGAVKLAVLGALMAVVVNWPMIGAVLITLAVVAPTGQGVGADVGWVIARLMMGPIRREQAFTATMDGLFPEAMGPLVGDYTSWRYVPLLGVTARDDGSWIHREIDNAYRLMGRDPRGQR